MHVVGAARLYDSRNTSAVRQPSPFALEDLTRELERMRGEQPELVEWIEAGYPTLTEAEHVERFGEPYRAGRRRRSS